MTLAERFAKDGGAVGAETEAFFVRALKGTGEERAALSALFDAALRTPTGRGMLEGAVGAGYSFAFEEGLDANSQSGACDSALKAIVLNPKCSFGGSCQRWFTKLAMPFRRNGGLNIRLCFAWRIR